jgi:hypothetical protein
VVAAVPIARGGDVFQTAAVRMVGIAFLVLVAGLVLVGPSLVPVSAFIVGGVYGAELAISDAPLDAAAPMVAAGLFLAVELGYWSLDERGRWQSEAGAAPRRAALVALLAAAAALVAAGLGVFVDAVQTTSLAVDLVGATAAAALLVAVLLLARGQSSSGS